MAPALVIGSIIALLLFCVLASIAVPLIGLVVGGIVNALNESPHAVRRRDGRQEQAASRRPPSLVQTRPSLPD
jgi:hypothetical protein